MSEIHRVNPPQPGASIPPVRPSRKIGREARKREGRGRRERERDTSETPAADDPREDDPGKGGSIDLRV